MSEMKTPWTIAFEPSGQRWIISVASQPILLPPMHQAGQTHCNLAWLRTMACNKLWRNSTHSLEASSQSQEDWGLGNFRRLCFQFPSSPFCWSSVPEYLVDGIHRGSNHPIHWWNWELGHFSHYDQRVSQMWYQDLYTGIAIHTNSLKEEAAKNYVTMRGDRSEPYVRASTHVTFITGARWPNQRRKAMITNALLSPFSVLWERNNNNAWYYLKGCGWHRNRGHEKGKTTHRLFSWTNN